MTMRDLIEISAGNLRRMRLRTFLTVSGVVIAIATFVTMVSFGAGNQRYLADQFNELGLFSTVQVFPLNKTAAADTARARVLDAQALTELSAIPGVRLAYPFDAITVTAVMADSQISAKAQAVPVVALRTKLLSKLAAGKTFESDSARSAIVAPVFLHQFGITKPDSALGRQLVLSVKAATIDSGLATLLPRDPEYVREKLRSVHYDSLPQGEYRQKLAHSLANEAIARFVNGFVNNRATVCETVTIVGVMEPRGDQLRTAPILISVGTATHFRSAGISGDPSDMLSAMTSGSAFTLDAAASSKTYPQVTLDVDPSVPLKPITDSVKALGFRHFSFAEMFQEITQFYFYFTLALGVVGLIALLTAALGIINTMVMSILERRREIGVLKSLGADVSDIRLLFLMESAVIGAVGSSAGILFGWLGTRVASFVMKMMMEKQGVGPVELFALPIWLILLSLAVGVSVSLLAGYYPASRAAKVDPVEALRAE